MIGETVLPMVRDQATLPQAVDVRPQAEGDDVRNLFTADHFFRLPRRTSMRLLDGRMTTGRLFVRRHEQGIQCLIEFPGRVVGDIDDRILMRGRVRCVFHAYKRGADDEHRQSSEIEEQFLAIHEARPASS